MPGSVGKMFFQAGKHADDMATITRRVEQAKVPTAPAKQADDLVDGTTKPRTPEMGLPSAKDPKARNINFSNLETEGDVLQLLDDVSLQNDNFLDARRGVVGHEETVAKSKKYSIEDILGRKPGEAFNAEQITAGRNILIDSAEKLQSAAKLIQQGNASEADMLAFRQMVARHQAVQAQVSGMTAEAGRALNAFKIQAEGGMLQVRQMREMLEATGGTKSAQALAEMIASADNPAEIAKIAREVGHANSADMLLEYWINGLLSSPATHMVNTTSNAMVALWQMPERALAAQVNKLFRSADGVQAGEATAQLFGMFRGVKDGLKLGWQALKTGEPTDAALKLEARKYRAITAENVSEVLASGAGRFGLDPESVRLGGPLAQAMDLLGEGVRVPGRLLTAEDEFFKAVGYRMELNAQALRQAKAEGLSGNALAERIAHLVNNPSEQIHMAAMDAARYQTFTNSLGETGQGFQRLANSHPVAKLLLPFVRTPTNIIKFVGHRSPLAPLAQTFRADIAAGGARRDLAIARMSLGSMVMGMGATMSFEGQITGGGPADKSQREALRRMGWQPYSVKVGDEYYSYNRLDPLGMFLGLSADVAEVMKYGTDEDRENIGAASAMALAKNLTSRTYLRGLSEFLDAVESGDEKKWSRYIQRQAATWTPATSMVAQVERTMDPTLRATYSIMDEIKARTPGLSETLPPRRNVWGEPIVLQGGLGWDFVSPVYSSTRKPSLADEEIYLNEVPVSMPRRTLGQGNFAVELSPEEYDRYVVLAGNEFKDPNTGLGMRDYLEQEVIPSDAYQNATEGPDGGRSLIIQQVIRQFRDGAKAQLQQEFPGLAGAMQQMQENKVDALLGQ